MRFVGVDPATRTGFVAIDYDGNVIEELELKGVGEKGKGSEISMPQLVDLENQLYRLIQPGDEIVIEQAAPGTQRGITTGMIHGGLRGMIIRRQLRYNEINLHGRGTLLKPITTRGDMNMKATGMVRKIDQLGRVVIPIELRRTLEINEADPLEIFVDADQVIFRKYRPGCNFCGEETVHRKIGEKNICLGCIRELQQGLR